jgi:hypothetical protein
LARLVARLIALHVNSFSIVSLFYVWADELRRHAVLVAGLDNLSKRALGARGGTEVFG